MRTPRLLVPLILAAFAILAVPMADNTDRPAPQSVFNDYYAARGQNYCWGNCPSTATRTCFAGDCPCFNEPYQTQCFAERKANFDRENPPRGELTGVCWAVQGRWERDPQSGNQVYRTRSPVYSRVRYNETQTLSTWARDDRDAGFEVEVEGAWKKFVQDTYGPDFPATDGWNWGMRCVSLDRPRKTEDKDWAKAQEQATYQRVFLPTYGIADTPEERALEAKLAAERKAKEAEIARQEEIKRREAAARAAEAERKRLAEEAARKAELARVEAERQKKIDAIAQQLGPGKRDAAERLQKMNDELAALRPKPKSPARQCTARSFSQTVSASGQSQASALANLRGPGGLCKITGSESRKSETLGAPNCTQRAAVYMKPPPVGKCLSCITEKMAISMYGYVPGKGYPPPPTEWVCTATVQCVAETCSRGPSRVTNQ